MEQALVVGVISGGIYGLYALGLVLVFKGSGVVNFAQAEIGTFALMAGQVVIVERGHPYLVGAAVALTIGLLLGVAFERAAVWPLRASPRLSLVVATIALFSLLIALELKVFGGEPRDLPAPLGGSSFEVFDVFVSRTQVLSLVVVLLVAAGLGAFLRYTDFGLGVLAAAQDQEAVRFLGVPLAKVSLFTWGLAGLLSALAALLIQPSVGVISASAFGGIFIRALGAALIGGLMSMPGAFAGGLVVGIAEAEIRHFTISSSFTGLPDVCIFLAVVATLVLRPQGLLGAR